VKGFVEAPKEKTIMVTYMESNEPEFQKTIALDKTLLITKLYVPPPCQILVPRPRLSIALSKALISSLTLVSAPAGYGKTTLVSSWLRENDVASAWLSLDDGDNDPIRFLQYFIITLQKLISEIQLDLLSVIRGTQPDPFEALLNIIINQIAGHETPLILVLDDFHTIHAQPVLGIITYLLDHIPPQLHLILITRADPPLLLSRLRVRGQLVDIRENHLRFTRDEITSFLNEVMGLKLTDDAITALEAKTEGWIAGLQLAALSMQGSKDIPGFISAFTGSHHYVMEYLVEEVLKLQPEKVEAFLLQTSILDHMCGPLCEAVVEADTDGQAMLEALEGMNLFTIPLDDERRWYRYHHLLADVLRKRLEHQFPHLRPGLHQRASQWYEQNGLIPDAIRHSLTAGDQDRAIQLIEQNGCLLLIRGELSTLPHWIKAVEPSALTRPWMYIFKAWLFALTGCPDRVEEMLQIAEKLISSLEPDAGIKVMQGAIATARAYRTNLEGETDQAASFARQALEYLPDIDLVSRSLRTVATSLLGDACSMNGELEQARQAYMEARQIGQAAGDIHLVIVANSNLANILIEQGLLHQAARIYSDTLQMATRPDGQKLVIAGRVYLELSQVSYEWNNLETAIEQVYQGLALCRQWGNLDLQTVGSVMLARLEQAQSRPTAARDAMYVAEKLANEHHLLPRYFIWVKYTLARLWIAQGDLEEASRIVQESGITIDDEILYLREPEYLVLLRLLLAQGDYDAALTLSKRLLQKAEASKRMGRMIEVLVLQALIYQGRKELDQALAVLNKALSRIKSERYIRTFLDEGEPMARLLHLARSRQIETEYATHLLSIIGEDTGTTRPGSQSLIEPLTLREVEVLKLIEAGCTNQDIADRLVISIPTVKRHISNIYAKLGVKSRTQAVAIGKELRLVE
jgi:LuxR family transcriptional regulator, maltose regulon positive regulatory protein